MQNKLVRKEIKMNEHGISIRFFNGRLGRERGFFNTYAYDLPFNKLPNKGDLITLPTNQDSSTTEVYRIIDVLYDYFPSDSEDRGEIDYFVKLYDWEE